MTAPRAADLPALWTSCGDLWWRVEPRPGEEDYTWFNGDKRRTWTMLSHNRGPLFATAPDETKEN